MLRKALTLGIVFILALSLLSVSLVTCFTLDTAEAHPANCVGDWVFVDGEWFWIEFCDPPPHPWHTG